MILIRTIFFFIGAFSYASSQAQINEYFDQIKTNPKALYTFFKVMPKGGELHYYLAGGPYPETMLSIASKGDYCLNKQTLAVTKAPAHCDGIAVKNIYSYPALYNQTLEDWSMKNFKPGKESGHDHFFKGFSKYMPIVINNKSLLIADVITRAARQEEQYLELMDLPDDANSLRFGPLIENTASYEDKMHLLLANQDFQNNIDQSVAKIDNELEEARLHLNCTQNPTSKPCQIQVKFLYYVLREQPLDMIFSQALTAFEAVSRSKGTLVGVNLVQPEDGVISLRDYHQQMLIFNFLHKKYPQVHIALHAGELTAEFAPAKDLGIHIEDALLTGNAQRIGHGVDVRLGTKTKQTLRYMAKHQIPAEINLISNKKILNVSGADHPLNTYLKHHVPVVFSSDDEGVLRTNLTQQYVEATLAHGLEYQTLKQINRNTLTYAFLPGKSIWANATKAVLIKSCRNLNSKRCMRFIKANAKAKLQWNLEQQLIRFESKYNN